MIRTIKKGNCFDLRLNKQTLMMTTIERYFAAK